MTTINDLQEQSKNLTQLLQKETETIDNAIIDFKKGIASQIDLILTTDYFTKIKPALIEKMYSIGKDDGRIGVNDNLIKYGFGLDGSINRYKKSQKLLSDEDSLAGITVNFNHMISHEGNLYDLLCNKEILPFNTDFDNRSTQCLANKNEFNIYLSLVTLGSKKYVSFVNFDAKMLYREYAIGFLESKIEGSKTIDYSQNQVNQIVSIMEKYDIMQSDKFRLYVNNLNDSAQSGDRPSIKALGVIDVYFAKERSKEFFRNLRENGINKK